MAAGAVGSLGGLWSAYQEAVGAAGRVFELLRSRPNLRDPDAPAALPRPVRGAVAFDDVWFRYETPDELPKLDFPQPSGRARSPARGARQARRRRRTGRCAASPSASTRARRWRSWAPPARERRPSPRSSRASGTRSRGACRWTAIDVRELRLADLRDAVGLVPQETLLFSGTVRENIAYGRPDATEAEVEAAARAAHAHEFVQLLPEGYDTRGGRARHQAQRRAAAARRPGARHPQGPRRAGAGRGHQQPGRRERGAHRGRAEPPAGEPDDAHHRAPPVHRAPRGPAAGAGGRAGSWRPARTPS